MPSKAPKKRRARAALDGQGQWFQPAGSMGIDAIIPKPRQTSGRNRELPVFPYLLRGVKIDRPNPVCAMDTTCIPMRCGFV